MRAGTRVPGCGTRASPWRCRDRAYLPVYCHVTLLLCSTPRFDAHSNLPADIWPVYSGYSGSLHLSCTSMVLGDNKLYTPEAVRSGGGGSGSSGQCRTLSGGGSSSGGQCRMALACTARGHLWCPPFLGTAGRLSLRCTSLNCPSFFKLWPTSPACLPACLPTCLPACLQQRLSSSNHGHGCILGSKRDDMARGDLLTSTSMSCIHLAST